MTHIPGFLAAAYASSNSAQFGFVGRYVVCDSYESPRKVALWDLQAGTAFTVGTFKEANWPDPETGRTGLYAHFTPDGTLQAS